MRFTHTAHTTQTADKTHKTHKPHKTHAMAIVCRILRHLPSRGIPNLPQAEPGPALPAGFNGATGSENSSQVGIEEFFNDPTLTSLINQALVGKQDLKILAQYVRHAEGPR